MLSNRRRLETAEATESVPSDDGVPLHVTRKRQFRDGSLTNSTSSTR